MQAALPDTDNMRQETLISRVAGGDTGALAELYGSAAKQVFGFALSILKNTRDAEDVLQDVFIKVWSAAGSYRAQGKPMAWILTITKNLAMSRLRESSRLADIPEDEWRLFYVESPAVTQEDRLVLDAAMRSLTDEERQIIMLHAISGLKHAEIAALLGLPLSTVLSKYSRSKVKLQNILREE